eukprot:bmy_20643T0
MVTIITGLPLDNPRMLSGPMQAALRAAAHASVDIKNVLEFYKQWKEIGSRPMTASGSQACMPVRALCPPVPWSLRFVIWAAVLGQSGMPSLALFCSIEIIGATVRKTSLKQRLCQINTALQLGPLKKPHLGWKEAL